MRRRLRRRGAAAAGSRPPSLAERQHVPEPEAGPDAVSDAKADGSDVEALRAALADLVEELERISARLRKALE